jgi:hypothetical protein
LIPGYDECIVMKVIAQYLSYFYPFYNEGKKRSKFKQINLKLNFKNNLYFIINLNYFFDILEFKST